MNHWWFSEAWEDDRVWALSWVIWVVVSITLHELGHGFMALRCGDDTPRALNRMTLNPFVHIPGMAWIMFALFGFTWGLMPVSPSNFRGRYDDAKVSFAGPAVNLGLFVLCAVGTALWVTKATSVQDPIHHNVQMFLMAGTGINLMGFLFNLIPVPPLDGSHILSDFWPQYRRIWTGPNSEMTALIVFGAMFFFLSKKIWIVAWAGAADAIDLLSRAF